MNGVILTPSAGSSAKPSFDDLTFKLGDGVILYGTLINAIVTFLIVAATLFADREGVRHREGAAEAGQAGRAAREARLPAVLHRDPGEGVTRCPACTGEIQPLVA